MRTMYLDLDPARIVLTRVLGKVWRGAYFARIVAVASG